MTPGAVTVVHVAETGSTNADAMARASAGAELPFWIVADRQTAGKGRSGRAWVSVPGNLHASLAIQLSCGPARASQLSLVAGVAVIDALGTLERSTPGAAARLKWPNDIVIGGAKCGGILIETVADRKTGRLIAVIGFGVNVVSCPDMVGRDITRLNAHGFCVSPKSMLAALTTAMDSALTLWNEGEGFAQLRQRWLDHATPLGTKITINTGRELTEGRFAGLDGDGALLLKEPGGRIQRFTFGDVTLPGALAT
jgi:BirA family transcriptional regulator, biotin operon repressor / biotin---[acetyl-CoA-carboxylase] ligase